MKWITIVEWPGGTIEDFDRERGRRSEPDGIVARYCGMDRGNLKIVAVWESKDAADRFFAAFPEDVKARLAPKSNGVPIAVGFGVERTLDPAPAV